MKKLNLKCEKYIDEYLKEYSPYKGKWCYEDGYINNRQRYCCYIHATFERCN